MAVKKRKAIIVDIDDCITYENFVGDIPTSNSREEWDKFHADRKYYDISLYKPIEPIIDLISSYYNGCKYSPKIIFITARENTANGLILLNTYRFIRENFTMFHSSDDFNSRYKLFMRSENDYRPSAEVKKEIIENLVLPDYEPILMFDDDIRNIEIGKELGIVGLQVHPVKLS